MFCGVLNTTLIFFHSATTLVVLNWVFVFLDPRASALILDPRPSAPISWALGPQNIARLNTILLFDFEVVFTLKL